MSNNFDINIKALHNKQNYMNKQENNTYNNILESCYKTIVQFNNFKFYECYYEPPIIASGPSYNYIDLIKFLINTLRNKGFNAYWDDTKNKIYISWKIDQRTLEDPIEQYNIEDVKFIQGYDTNYAELKFPGGHSSKFPINLSNIKK